MISTINTPKKLIVLVFYFAIVLLFLYLCKLETVNITDFSNKSTILTDESKDTS